MVHIKIAKKNSFSSKSVLLAFSLIILFLITISSQEIFAVSLGVSPASLSVFKILRGGYAETSLFISTGDVYNITGKLESIDKFKDWITFSDNTTEFFLTPGKNKKTTIVIRPPKDTPVGNYTGWVMLVGSQTGSVKGRAGGLALPALRIKLTIEVIGEQILKCNAGGVFVRDLEEDTPLEIAGTIKNTGNVKVIPKGSITIKKSTKNQTISKRTFNVAPIKPTTQRTFNKILGKSTLKEGEYIANIKVEPCDISTNTRFHVYKKGDIRDIGKLENVKSSVWAYVKDSIPITATFYNAGPRTVIAQFKGTIISDSGFTKVIESSELEIEPGERTQFLLNFIPPHEDRYIVSGKVYYNRKVTSEQGTVINVIKKDENNNNNKKNILATVLPLLLYLIIIIISIHLIRLIKKNRKRKI